MKILIVGQFTEASLEHHYVKYIKNKAEVYTFPAENIFDKYYYASLFNKVKFRFGTSPILKNIAEQLLAKIGSIKPDIVWVFKGMRLLPSVLKKIKQTGVQLVNYNPDHPFVFSSKGSGNQLIANSVGLYDLHLCYDSRVAHRIETEYGIPTALLPFGFELPDEQLEDIKTEEEINAVAFIGACDSIRIDHVLHLVQNGIEVHVFGNNWQKMLQREVAGLKINGPVYHNEFWQTMRKYRVQLNVFKPHNEGCHNMRTFEVPGSGGIMLAPDSPDHREYFEAGEEIFLYSSKDEMATKAKQILNMPKEEAESIRKRARAKCLSAGYSYEKRAGQAYQAFLEILQPA